MATKVKLIETGAVTGNIIPDGDITTGKLANDAVTTIKISDANITHAKLHTSMDLTGKTVTVATAAGSTNTTAVASTAFVQQELTTLIGGAPSTLNDLNELAAAINDDSNYNSTLTTALATKLPLAGGTLTGALTSNSLIKTTGDLEIASTQPRIMLDRSDGAYTWNIYNGSGSGNFPQSTFNIANNAGTAVITALDSGNVGIGTTSPTADLSVGSTTTSSGDVHLRTTKTTFSITPSNTNAGGILLDLGWVNGGQGPMKFGIGGAEKMRISPAGDVGIGNIVPAQTLEIHNSNASDYTDFGLRGTGHKYVIGVGNASASTVNDKWYLYDNDNSAFRMVVNTSGNVGIGTTSPTRNLTVKAGSGQEGIELIDADESLFLIQKSGSSTNTSYVSMMSEGNTTVRLHADNVSYFNGGNVGIGTSSPGALLDLETAGNTLDGSYYSTMTINNTGSSTYSGVRFDRSGAARWRVGLMPDDTFQIAKLYNTVDDTAFVINSNGKVGIGTSNPTGKLHVSGGRAGIISTDSSWGQFRVGNTSDAEVGIAYVTSATESDFLNDGDPACGYKVIMGINPYSAGTRNFGIGNDTILNYHTIWTEAGHQEPRVDNTYDLGSSTKGFRNVYLSSDLSVGGNVTKPIQTTTDTGTRMYTGLATGSHYQSTGFLILDTTIPDPGQSAANMFSIHINGYSYDATNGGIIDLVIGTYSGEGYFHNASYTGSNIPDKWVNNVRFARKSSTNTVSIILGDSGTSQPNEVAATLFIQGFGSTNTAYAQGWDWKISTSTTGYTQLTEVNEKSTKRPSFSANSSGFSVSGGVWQVISDSMSQTHDGPDDNYNPSNGRFTPQLPGWYQFNFGGYATYNSTTGYERYAIAFAKNGSLAFIAGGNYSNADSPLGGAGQRVYLNGSSDYVELKAFSSVATQWGASGHRVWWDGYWTGS
jgi:hypothetical protein